ncbi:hypothetical protein BVX95_01380 [archaeon D22]|nr:hypothetical protein BVX95_01380 [archaeon D22]
MKKIGIMMLIFATLMIAGCSSPEASVCGDGVCSFLEKSKDNCPMDCKARAPDLSLDVEFDGGTVDAYSDLVLDYTIRNRGDLATKFVVEFDVERLDENEEYSYGRGYSRQEPVMLGEGENFNDKANFWIREEGNYRISMKTYPVNERDSFNEDNSYEAIVSAAKPSYPEYIIEENISAFEYQYTRKWDNGIDFDEIEAESTYNAQYEYVDEYENSAQIDLEVTTYGQDITVEARDFFMSYSSFEAENYKGDIIFIDGEDYGDMQFFEVVWPSNDKLVRLFIHFNEKEMDGDYIEEFVDKYLAKFDSSVEYNMLCGDNKCQYNNIFLQQSETYSTEFNDNNVHEISVLNISDTGAQITIDDDTYFEFSEIGEVVDYNGQSIELRNLAPTEIEFIDFTSSNVEIVVATINEEGNLKNYEEIEVQLGKEYSVNFDEGNYSIKLIKFKEDVAVIEVNDDKESIILHEEEIIGGLYVRVDDIDIDFDTETRPEAVILNIGENYQACPSDCAPMVAQEEPMPVSSSGGSAGESGPVMGSEVELSE